MLQISKHYHLVTALSVATTDANCYLTFRESLTEANKKHCYRETRFMKMYEGEML